jgi:ABC-type Zn uptake system ZnuABC Zn-binding protein ZnuA
MHRVFLILFAAISMSAFMTRSALGLPADKLKVVTTLPDLANIVQEVGGDRVEVSSIARGRENTHAVTVRPSHLVAISRADLFVQVGLSLESSYVPGLLETCRNKKIQPGSPGFVNVSDGWPAIDVPASLSRAGGDIHPQGNPHMNLAPGAGRHIADRILAALVAVDPGSAEAHRRRHAAYAERLAVAEARWASMSEPWSGRKIVVYHQEYSYLSRAYGLEILDVIEPKPGIPPSPGDLTRIIANMRESDAKVVLTAIWSNGSTMRRIADATGAQVVELPNMCAGIKGTETWIDMMEYIHVQLAGAFGTVKGD